MSNTNYTPSTAATIKSSEIVQQQLDAALKKSGMDPAAITNLLTTVSSSIVCDDECQKRKQIDALKLKYDAAKQNVKDAPFELKTAEKNYYEYAEGDEEYRKMLLERYTKTAKEMKKKSLIKHDEIMKDINILYKDLETTRIYEKRMIELLKIKTQEYDQLKQAVDQDLASTETNDRKVEYEDHEYQGLHSVRKWTTVFYYFLIPCYLYFSDFFAVARYKSVITWILLVIYCLFPLLINPLSKFIFFIKDQLNFYMNNKASKNVYEDI